MNWWKYITILLLIFMYEGSSAVSVYNTLADETPFANFIITNAIPSDGLGGSSPIQSPVTLADNWITFEFRGFGNALLLFKKDDSSTDFPNIFMVIIGGDPRYNSIIIDVTLDRSEPVASMDLGNVTSASEFRWFWVSWDKNTTSVSIGNGSIPYENRLVTANNVLTLNFDVTSLAISTGTDDAGDWRFPHESSSSTIPPLTSTSLQPSLSAVSATITSTAPTAGQSKAFLDKPENVAAIATAAVVPVAGLATGVVLHKRCKRRSVEPDEGVKSDDMVEKYS